MIVVLRVIIFIQGYRTVFLSHFWSCRSPQSNRKDPLRRAWTAHSTFRCLLLWIFQPARWYLRHWGPPITCCHLYGWEVSSCTSWCQGQVGSSTPRSALKWRQTSLRECSQRQLRSWGRSHPCRLGWPSERSILALPCHGLLFLWRLSFSRGALANWRIQPWYSYVFGRQTAWH